MHMRAHTLLKVGACNAAPAFLSSAESTANNSNAQLFLANNGAQTNIRDNPTGLRILLKFTVTT